MVTSISETEYQNLLTQGWYLSEAYEESDERIYVLEKKGGAAGCCVRTGLYGLVAPLLCLGTTVSLLPVCYFCGGASSHGLGREDPCQIWLDHKIDDCIVSVCGLNGIVYNYFEPGKRSLQQLAVKVTEATEVHFTSDETTPLLESR